MTALESPPEPRLLDVLALSVTFVALGMSVAVAVADIGTAAWTNVFVGVAASSATSELAFVAVRNADGTVFAALLSGWLVASRFGIIAVPLGARMRAGVLERLAAALLCVEPSVAFALQQHDPARLRAVYWKVTGVLVGAFNSGVVLGVIAGNVIGDLRTYGLDAVFPAALLSIVAGSLRRRDGAVAALIGGVCCLALLPHTPGGVPILAAVVGAFVGLAIPRRPPADLANAR